MPRFVRSTRLPVDVDEAFAWHERPGALQRLSPPFLPGKVERSDGSITPGSEVVLRLGPPRLAPRWVARHTTYEPPREFAEYQASGPFAAWNHRHRFAPDATDRALLTDDVTYRLPLGQLGEAVAGPLVRQQIARMFAYRHRVTVADLATHAAARSKGVRSMRVAITGASGLIGQALSTFLTTGGHDVVPVVRSAPGPNDVGWNPDEGEIDAEALRGVDAVVHLAGEPIAARRWTEAQKQRILDSRVKGTRLLAETLAELGTAGPSTLVSASGIHYYGDRGDEVLTEDSAPGDGFLEWVCREWEAATAPAADAGVRVVNLRTGIALTPRGGALARQLPLFRLGVGGPFGNGRQYDSWISLEDVIGLYHHALTNSEVSGPMNATAPNPVTNAEFARVLGTVLRRPARLPVPKLGPKLLLGEMAEALVYTSQRALPRVALDTGYQFRHPHLEGCLRELLGRPGA